MPTKVLRIGVLVGGKVVQERLVRPGSDVTIGSSPRNTFVVDVEGIPSRTTLFTSKHNKTSLCFTESMQGKVALDRGVLTFEQLRGDPSTSRRGDAWLVPLSDKSRGKISLGGITILFQFVPAPPESARLVTAADFRPKLLDDDDPVFLGFLALFSALAAVLMVYVFNTEPVDLVKPEDIPDRFADILIQEPSEPVEPPEPEEVELEVRDDGQIASKQKEAEKAEPVEAKPRTEAEAKAAEAAAKARQREETIQKSKLLSALIGTRGENNSGQMVEDLLGDQENKFSNLQEALEKVDGAGIASEAAIQANKGATDAHGTGDASIGDLARAEVGEGRGVGSGPGTSVSGRADIGGIDAADAEGADSAQKTIRRYKGQIQACYEGELKNNPNLRGRMALAIDVKAGRVTNVAIEDNGTGSKAVADCVRTKVRRWRFDAEVTGTVYPTFVLAPSG
ncbi:MAG: hypothetical protein D6798_03940 [Deltaproteobacteria bacterium]|nr:MAG: hypothetical protein D6798_03940 [Deltaproteobacteria bacterium]